MELDDYLRIFRRYWVGVVIITQLMVAVAAGVSYVQPKVYAANATGFVSTGTSQNAAEASVGDAFAKSRAASYVELARSRAVARDVAAQLNLDTSPSALISRITVVQPLDTVHIKITARDSSPRAAQGLADAWVAALAEQVTAIEGAPAAPAEGEVTTEGTGISLVPIESAELPGSPVSPNVKRNLALGLLLGLLLGAGYALLRARLDRRITSSAQVEREFSVPVVAAIPATSALGRDTAGRQSIVADGPPGSHEGSHAREALLKLRTNLQFMDVDNPPRVLVVTSPLPGDGKSTVAANLAAVISATGEHVVLIDGDLRRPVVADSFGLVDSVGLTNLIVGSAQIDEVAQPHPSLPNLWVITAGPIPPNPSELLGSRSMSRLLSVLSEQFTVVIDAPPLLPVTDAAVLTANADGALVVISSGKTLDSQLQDALAMISQVQGNTLGIVFNRVAKRDSSSGYYGTYDGGYLSPPVSKNEKASARARSRVERAERLEARRPSPSRAPEPRPTSPPTDPGTGGKRRASHR